MNRYLICIARVLMGLIFVISGVGKIMGFSGTEAMLASKGLPLAAVATAVVIVIEVAGGLLLMIGLWSGWAALVLFLYLIPVTLTMHNFWAAPPDQHQNQLIHFLKNLSIMGGLLAFYTRQPR